MKTRTISILTVVLALLACLYYFDYKRMVDLETADIERKRVVAAGPDAIGGLSFRNQHGEFTLERRADGAWWLTAPVDERADQGFVVNTLLPALDAARKFGRFDASGAQPEDYGFGEAGMALTVRAEGEETVRLSLGKETVIGGEVYLRDDSEPDVAWVTGSDLFLALDKTLSNLRDKTVVPATFDRVTQLAFSTNGSKGMSALSRPTPTGTWTVRNASGREHPADAKGAEQLFQILQAMVLADETTTPTVVLAEGTAQHPEFLVSIEYLTENATPSSTTLRFRSVAPVVLPSAITPAPDDVEPEPERPYYATIAGRDLLFNVTPGFIRILADPVMAFRDRRVFTLQTEDVAWFQVEALEDASHSVTALERAAGGMWNFADGSTEPVNQVKTKQYLTFCLRQSVAAFEPAPPATSAADAGLDDPVCRITVANSDRSVREGIEIGRLIVEGGDRYYARRVSTGDTAGPIFSVELPDPFLKVLGRTQRFFAVRSVLRFDTEEVAQVKIEFFTGTTTTVVLSRVEGGVSPWQGTFDDEKARALPENLVDLFLAALGSMEYLVVLPHVEPAIAEQYGLAAPTFRLRLIGAGGEVVDGITFGKPPEDKKLLLVEDHFGKFMYVKQEAFGSIEQSLAQVITRLR